MIYADDIALYHCIEKQRDYTHNYNTMLQLWISDNYLKLNASKCCYMTFSNKRSPSYPDTPLYISENCLLLKDEFKYLGVTLISDLNWANHVATICNKAKKLIGMFYRKLYSFSSSRETPLKLYKKQLSAPTLNMHLRYGAHT